MQQIKEEYNQGINLLKNGLQKIEKQIPNFHYIYGINILSNMHIIKVEAYEELIKNDIYKEMEYALFDAFYQEIINQDLTFTDISDKYVNIDICL